MKIKIIQSNSGKNRDYYLTRTLKTEEIQLSPTTNEQRIPTTLNLNLGIVEYLQNTKIITETNTKLAGPLKVEMFDYRQKDCASDQRQIIITYEYVPTSNS
ncbi:unnamed protein product [Hermetia illucens]|uniref:Uncharacterized protein n=1 Tax=Hermetia illucens TaxID=343691 RepID=A0A7R8V536_HERIL|nr:unnamed protein product [Hermetia illucens]